MAWYKMPPNRMKAPVIAVGIVALGVLLFVLSGATVSHAPASADAESASGHVRPTLLASPSPSLLATVPVAPMMSVNELDEQNVGVALRMPDVPIFGDFTAYTWPTAENVTSEVLVHDSLRPPPRRDTGILAVQRPRSVSLDFPCAATGPGTDLSGRRVSMYVPWPNPISNTPHPIAHCPIRCDVTSDASKISSVDGYLVDTNWALINEKYHWPSNPLNKYLILFNTENVEGRRSVLKRGYGIRYLAKPYNHTLWEQFHIVISHHWHSNVRLSFFEWANCRTDDISRTVAYLGGQSRLGKIEMKDKSLAPVLFFARNCDFVMHKRQGFVRKLRESIAVDAVGKCLNSREQTSVRRCQAFNSKNKRPCIIAQYPFYLAIENSISLDYVTEKVYEPLLLGTIPVYLGAPNVGNFLPAAHSVIIATDFKSVRSLAKYLQCVAGNASLFAYYSNWRDRPRLPTFDTLQRQYTPLCQACLLIDADRTRTFTEVNASASAPPRPPARHLRGGRPHVAGGTMKSVLDAQRPLIESCAGLTPRDLRY